MQSKPPTTMIRARDAFYAALLRSLLRTKRFIQAILNLWISPSPISAENSSFGQPITEARESRSRQTKPLLSVAKFLESVELELRGKVDGDSLLKLSDGLKMQLEQSLVDSQVRMLPSYNHQLPTGNELGTYLALDVGGSTFRVALVELLGRGNGEASRISIIRSFKINQQVKRLEGIHFFDWMAQRIEETLSGKLEGHISEAPLSMGLAWSFPIEQTSLRSGRLQGMGKGFMAAHGLLGQDLGDLIQDSCSRHGLNVQLNAIVNDSSATLLSKAYLDDATHFGLILGTGVNAAVHLPVRIFSPTKFGSRPAEWHAKANHVIVNTELSMFGAGILPLSRWDKELNANHKMPDFQPLEYCVSGGYLGELARLILIEGIRTAGLFNGIVPESLKEKNSLDSETISRIEGDSSPNLSAATEFFLACNPTTTPPSYSDILALRTIASHVSYRASAFLAAAIHALWRLRNDAEGIQVSDREHTLVAYNGSVMENYPRYQEMCQNQLNLLAERSGAASSGILELEHAEESSLLGAAVAVACRD